MSIFRDIIARKMRHYSHLQLEEGNFTIGALVSAVLSIHDQETAAAFYEGYLAYMKAAYPQEDAQRCVQANIGWCFGEAMPDADRAMWIAVCGASHPVLGQANVTAQQEGRGRGRCLSLRS